MVNLLEVPNIYEFFWGAVTNPKYYIVAGASFLAYLLLKSTALTIAGYKKFGWALLISLVSCIITTGALTAVLYFDILFTDDFLVFFGAVLGGFIFLDALLMLIFKRRSGYFDGLIGSTLGTVLTFAAGLVFYIFQIF